MLRHQVCKWFREREYLVAETIPGYLLCNLSGYTDIEIPQTIIYVICNKKTSVFLVLVLLAEGSLSFLVV